jgi:hypothetical protein
MEILIIPSDLVDKLKSIEFPKGNTLDPISGTLNDTDIFWLPSDLMDATYIDNDGNEQPLYSEVLADFQTCDTKDIDTIEDKYYDADDNEIVPITTVTVTTTTKTTTDAQDKQTVETDPVGDPIEESIYQDANGNVLNVIDLKHKFILTETVQETQIIQSAQDTQDTQTIQSTQVTQPDLVNRIGSSISVFVSDRVTDVINGISWVWDSITGWFKS